MLWISIVQFNLKQYPEAQKSFESAKELNPNERTLATWLRKVQDVLPPPPPPPAPKQEEQPAPAVQAPAPSTPQNVRAR